MRRRWAADFLEQLHDIKGYQTEQSEKILTASDQAFVIEKSAKAQKRLIILDYDGTIRNFVASPDPHKAKPPIKLKRLLCKLIALPNTRVCIVSGRTKGALDGWFQGMDMLLVAEHGAWIKDGGKWVSTPSSFNEYKQDIIGLLTSYADRTAGAEIEEKDHSIVWHYRNVPTELAYVRNVNVWRDLQTLVAGSDISVYAGNKVFEIKPEHINKGSVVTKILAKHPAGFILCAGDDYTDEDMFAALPDSAVTIKIGLGSTAAKYQLSDNSYLLQLLARIAS